MITSAIVGVDQYNCSTASPLLSKYSSRSEWMPWASGIGTV